MSTRRTTTARAVLDAAMDEATFRHAVQGLLTTHQWRWSYIPDSRQVQGWRGIPDIIAVRNGRLLFIELKTERGHASRQQREWIVDLAVTQALNATVEVFIWRPRHMATIERVLSLANEAA